jgi:hypothetical protein
VTGANHGFRAALPHVLGVPFGFASMLIAGAAGVAALLLTLPIHRSIDQVGRHCVSAFHCVAARSAAALESYRLEAAVRRLSLRQSESMDARCGYRRIVHGEQCDRRPYRNYCYCVFDRCIGSLEVDLARWAIEIERDLSDRRTGIRQLASG